jgi:hypothetical protein
MERYGEIDEILHQVLDQLEGDDASADILALVRKVHDLIDEEQAAVVKCTVVGDVAVHAPDCAHFQPLNKVGRVLSAKNEKSLADARNLLDFVLSQLGIEGEEETEKRLQPVAKMSADGDIRIFAPILKMDEEQKTVTGHALAANVVDLQDDFIRANEIRKAMETYMLEFQDVGVMHQELNENLRVIECYQAQVDMVINGAPVGQGDWLMTVKCLDDAIWERVKSGELRGFSIGGRAKRVKMAKPEDVKFLDEVEVAA